MFVVGQQDLVPLFKLKAEEDGIQGVRRVSREADFIHRAAELFAQPLPLFGNSDLPAQFIHKTHGMTGYDVIVCIKIVDHPSWHGPRSPDVHIYLIRVKDELILNGLPELRIRQTGVHRRDLFGCRRTRHGQAQGASCGHCSRKFEEMSPVNVFHRPIIGRLHPIFSFAIIVRRLMCPNYEYNLLSAASNRQFSY